MSPFFDFYLISFDCLIGAVISVHRYWAGSHAETAAATADCEYGNIPTVEWGTAEDTAECFDHDWAAVDAGPATAITDRGGSPTGVDQLAADTVDNGQFGGDSRADAETGEATVVCDFTGKSVRSLSYNLKITSSTE